MPKDKIAPVIVHVALDARERSGRIEFRMEGRAGVVVVSRRALLSVASPPRSTEERLWSYASMFCQMAIAHSRLVGFDQDVLLVTANDVTNWLKGWRLTERQLVFPSHARPQKHLAASAFPRLVWSTSEAV
jgi:hypothetical protein